MRSAALMPFLHVSDESTNDQEAGCENVLALSLSNSHSEIMMKHANWIF